MAFAIVKKFGDSLVLELPQGAEAELHLAEGSEVELEVHHRRVSVRPRRYTLNELLNQCDYSQPMSEEEREWIDAPRVGRELIGSKAILHGFTRSDDRSRTARLSSGADCFLR